MAEDRKTTMIENEGKVNGDNNVHNNDNDDDDVTSGPDDVTKHERRQHFSRHLSGSPPPNFFNAFSSYTGNEDSSRQFKDRALNLALDFNGDRNGRQHQPRPSSPLLASPKREENEDRRVLSPDVEPKPDQPPTNPDGGNPASVVASVQSALAALQAGQISLNQVKNNFLSFFSFFLPSFSLPFSNFISLSPSFSSFYF